MWPVYSLARGDAPRSFPDTWAMRLRRSGMQLVRVCSSCNLAFPFQSVRRGGLRCAGGPFHDLPSAPPGNLAQAPGRIDGDRSADDFEHRPIECMIAVGEAPR